MLWLTGSAFPNIESLMDSLYESEELEQQGSDSESDSEREQTDEVCSNGETATGQY